MVSILNMLGSGCRRCGQQGGVLADVLVVTFAGVNWRSGRLGRSEEEVDEDEERDKDRHGDHDDSVRNVPVCGHVCGCCSGGNEICWRGLASIL